MLGPTFALYSSDILGADAPRVDEAGPIAKPSKQRKIEGYDAYHHDIRAAWISSREISGLGKRDYRADEGSAHEHRRRSEDPVRRPGRDFLRSLRVRARRVISIDGVSCEKIGRQCRGGSSIRHRP